MLLLHGMGKGKGHTSGVVGDDGVHESWHDGSEGGHSGEANGVCDREGAQRGAVAEPCVTRTGAGEEGGGGGGGTRRKGSQRRWRQCMLSFKVG